MDFAVPSDFDEDAIDFDDLLADDIEPLQPAAVGNFKTRDSPVIATVIQGNVTSLTSGATAPIAELVSESSNLDEFSKCSIEVTHEDFRAAFMLSTAPLKIPTNITPQEKLALAKRHNERISIAKQLREQEKKIAGNIADQIRLARTKGSEQVDQYSLTALVWGKGEERPVLELWHLAFGVLIDGEEYDIVARERDQELHRFIKYSRSSEGRISSDHEDWKLFNYLFLKITKDSPKHSLSRCIRIFSDALCILHGPLFDMEQDIREMVCNETTAITNKMGVKELIDDLKCFEQLLVHTIAYKYSIDIDGHEEPLFSSAQCAIYGFLGPRVEASIQSYVQAKLDVRQIFEVVPVAFGTLGISQIFQGYQAAGPLKARQVGPYSEAIETLRGIRFVTYPIAKLKVLSKVCNCISREAANFAKSHGKILSIGADDLVPLMGWVISHAQVRQFGELLSSLEELIPNDLLSGALAYALATCQGGFFALMMIRK